MIDSIVSEMRGGRPLRSMASSSRHMKSLGVGPDRGREEVVLKLLYTPRPSRRVSTVATPRGCASLLRLPASPIGSPGAASRVQHRLLSPAGRLASSSTF
eukprot:scaffold157853_cov30-Tisochrysis_lutea.AAC.1